VDFGELLVENMGRNLREGDYKVVRHNVGFLLFYT
jgi:hypothetical protein